MSNGVSETGLNLIPAGYKQTEVGIIPEDWECSNFDYICSTIGDGIHSTPTYNDNGEYFFINGNNLIDGKITTFNETKKTDFAEFYKHKKNLNERTILLSINGTIGNIAFYRDEQIVLGKSAAYLNIKSTIDKYYIYYCLGSEKTLQAFYDGLTGSTIKNLGLGTIRATNIPLPPKKEQTAIANTLSDVDALVSELEKLIAKKQAIKTATMQQLLTGRTRLPQFALRADGTPTNSPGTNLDAGTGGPKGEGQDGLRKSTKPSELGEIPEDWEVVTLGDIGQTVIGLTYSPNDVADFGTLVLRSSNVQNGKLAYADNVYVNMELPERVIVKQGDILICVRNGSRQLIGKCALIDENAEGSAFGAFMSIFRTKYSVFVFYQFQSDLIQNQINEIMGATINQITNKDMSGFKITLPSDEKEQTAIASILSDMDAEIQALEQRLGKTRQIKQGMMQELLTGKTRLIKGEAHG